MKLPGKRLTLRASIVVIALFAIDFGGLAWVDRELHPPRVGHLVLREDEWIPVNPMAELMAPVFFFAPIVLLFALICLYVPPRMNEILAALLILIVLTLLILPALQHS